MGERNIELEYQQERLVSLEKIVEALQEEIAAAVDPITKGQLEKRLTSVFQKISQVSGEIMAIEQQAQNQTVAARDSSLMAILKAHGDEGTICQAYQTTIAHWSADIDTTATTPKQILKELKRISANADYSALEEFIAHLRATTDRDRVLTALDTWGQQ